MLRANSIGGEDDENSSVAKGVRKPREPRPPIPQTNI